MQCCVNLDHPDAQCEFGEDLTTSKFSDHIKNGKGSFVGDF